MAIKAVVWRLRLGDREVFRYRLQAEGIDFRSKSKLLAAMEGWNQVGEIMDPRVNTHGLLFDRSFSDAAGLAAWALGFPYQVQLQSSTSERLYPLKSAFDPKTGTVTTTRAGARNKKRAKSKRRAVRCGTCGAKGHNARTCTSKSTGKRKKRKRTQCSKCGDFGHNVRTCKLSQREIDAAQSRRKRCGHCGETGHNRRTCPELAS